MSVHVRDELMQQLACSSCALPISFGPVRRSSKAYNCGRCPSKPDAEQNLLYETMALASNCLFPCKYKLSGCDVLLPFGKPMEDHEASCPKILYKCPMATRQECGWEGTFSAIEEHFKAIHSEIVLENLKMEVNLVETTEIRYAFFYKGVVFFLIDLSFNKTKGLAVELMRVLKNETVETTINEKCIMVLYNRDDKFSFSRNVGKYFLNQNCAKVSNNKFIDATFVNYITTDKKMINVKLDLPTASTTSSEINKQTICACKNRMYGCDYIEHFDKVQQHESTCIVYGCPLGKKVCGWQGIMNCIENHCREKHKCCPSELPISKLKEILSSGESIFFYTTNISIRACFRVCIKLEKIQTTDPLMYIAFQYIGEGAKHTKYKCTISFKESGKMRGYLKLNCSPFTTDEKAFENSTRISLEHFKESTLIFNFTFS